MAAWHDGAGSTLKLNLNLSARQFAEPTMPAQVKRIIGETGLAPGSVWLEITEDTLLHDRDASDQTLRHLHEVGVRLVIDDFGTGSSSLVSLKQFPLDAIKIASTFVADLGRDRDSDAICSAIVDLAHSLGLCAIAEGVETLEQFAALRGARLRARAGSSLRRGTAGRGVRHDPGRHAGRGPHVGPGSRHRDSSADRVRHPGAMGLARTPARRHRARRGHHLTVGSRPRVARAAAPDVVSITWHGCGDGFQCGTLTVPLDPAESDGAAADSTSR